MDWPSRFRRSRKVLEVGTRREKLRRCLGPCGADSREDHRLPLLIMIRNDSEQSVNESNLAKLVSLRAEDVFCSILGTSIRDHLFTGDLIEV